MNKAGPTRPPGPTPTPIPSPGGSLPHAPAPTGQGVRTSAKAAPSSEPRLTTELTTPDGRYLVVRGRLWRATNPALPPEARVRLTRDLMAGRRAVRDAKASGDEAALAAGRAAVNAAKTGLGERGEVWWKDGAPDLNRRLAKNTPYADWLARAESSDPDAGPE